MEALIAIEDALADVPAEDRTQAAAVVLVALAFERMAFDEDELNSAARVGLLLAAASGDPIDSCSQGSRAALETAAGLAANGYMDELRSALAALADEATPAGQVHVAVVLFDLQADQSLALEALAVVVLQRAME